MKDDKASHLKEDDTYNEILLAIYLLSTMCICYLIYVITNFSIYAWLNNTSIMDNFNLDVIWDRGYGYNFFKKRQPIAELVATVLSFGYLPFSLLIVRLLGLSQKLYGGFTSCSDGKRRNKE